MKYAFLLRVAYYLTRIAGKRKKAVEDQGGIIFRQGIFSWLKERAVVFAY
jgi:hypothetical protein